MAQFDFLKKDIARLLPNPNERSIRHYLRVILEQRLYALIVYRFGRWVYYEAKGGIFLLPLKFFYIFVNKFFIEILLGIYIPSNCEIGPGLYINNFMGLVINPRVKIGKNCSIGHGVIIGTAGDGTPNAPRIGDNVFIGSRAIIIGGITIGDNVRIGANAVVNKDIPSDVTAVGVPAKIVITRPDPHPELYRAR